MKIFAFAFAVFLAGVSAVPDLALTRQINERFIDKIVADVIEDLINGMKERELDPYHFGGARFDYKLPVTDLLTAEAAIKGVLVEGLSNIKINSIHFSIITTKLTLDVSLPLIFAEVGSAHAYVKFFGTEFSGKLSGSLAVEEIRVKAVVDIYIGIISGISLRSVDVNFSVNSIQSNLEVAALDRDLSAPVNKFFGEIITKTLKQNQKEINSLLEHIITLVVESLL